jgi:Calcineurin-like phosphoesterase
MSDLHLETPFARPTYQDFAATITPQSFYLALLGDIGYVCDTRLFKFLEAKLQRFEIVFFLLGNHEAYGMSFPAAEQTTTVKMFVTDFSRIENWETHDHSSAHESDVNWLNAEVKAIKEEEPERIVVISTHHSPTLLEAAADPMHKNDSTQTNSAFATDMSKEVCWSSTQVRLWAFGHTHYNCDFEDPHTKKRVFASQKGYR